MDTDMMDAGYDIDIDVGSGIEAPAPQPQQITEQDTARPVGDVPAAYYEDFGAQQHKAWPESLNLQGVSDFDPNDPLYYAIEHCGAEPRVKQLRWVSDTSVNLEFYTADDAAAALVLLSHESENPSSLSLQDSRRARNYSKKPDSILRIREANSGDQKPKGAANRSNYYQRNPSIRGNREREPPRRAPPRRDFLDYGEEEDDRRDPRRRSSGDESMGEDSGVERRQNNRRNDRYDRDTRGRGGRSRNDRASGSFRGDRNAGRLRDDRESGRLGADVDSYRPGTRSPRESQFGRLRGRSASPTSEDGDGRYGFREDNTNVRSRYRSRSRSRSDRRRREPSGDRWTHDRANYGTSGGRWQKDTSFDSSPMANHHRRSDAMDETRKGSLIGRMTKNGRPLQPLQKPSMADRITRDDDDDSSFGRLKGDDSEPAYEGIPESKPRRNLVDRISRPTDINIRGRGQEGINIRGAGGSDSAGGINIRGVASGA